MTNMLGLLLQTEGLPLLFKLIIGVIVLLFMLMVIGLSLIPMSRNAPMMCPKCGHTFTDEEDPAERCPVCGSD